MYQNKANFDLSFAVVTKDISQFLSNAFNSSGFDTDELVLLVDEVIEGLRGIKDYCIAESLYYKYRLYLFNLNRTKKLEEPPYPTKKFVKDIIPDRLNYFDNVKNNILNGLSDKDDIVTLFWYLLYKRNYILFKEDWFLLPVLNFSSLAIDFLKENCTRFRNSIEQYDGSKCDFYKKIDILKENEFSSFYSFPMEEIDLFYTKKDYKKYEEIFTETTILLKIFEAVQKRECDFIFYKF